MGEYTETENRLVLARGREVGQWAVTSQMGTGFPLKGMEMCWNYTEGVVMNAHFVVH